MKSNKSLYRKVFLILFTFSSLSMSTLLYADPLNYTLVIENNFDNKNKTFIVFDTSNANDCVMQEDGYRLIVKLNNTPDRKSCQIKFRFHGAAFSPADENVLKFDAWLIVDNFVPEFKIGAPTSNEGHNKCNNNTFDIMDDGKANPNVGVRCCTMKKSDKFGVLFVGKEKQCPALTNL